MKVLGADIGSRNAKLFWGVGSDHFDSTICHATELKMGLSKGDMVVTFNNQMYFVGSLAVREGKAKISPKGMNKVHEYTAIRLFAGMIRNNIHHVETLVIGQPIENCTRENGNLMRKMFVGMHTIRMNDAVHILQIDSVKMAPEGALAYFSLPTRHERAYVVDLGSGTINLAAMDGGRFVNNMSSTINFGNESQKVPSYEEIAEVIHSHTKADWDSTVPVFVCGGVAEKVAQPLQKYFSDVRVMKDHLFANAMGMYQMGCGHEKN